MSGHNGSLNQASRIRCAMFTIEKLLRGKWQVHILFALRDGPVRIGQLGRLIPGASKKVLTQSLRKLEANGIVVRKDMSEIVLHVEYEFHPGVRSSIGNLIDDLSTWGAALLEREGNTSGNRVMAKEDRP